MKKKEVESKKEVSYEELTKSEKCNPSSSMVDIVVSMKQDDIFGKYSCILTTIFMKNLIMFIPHSQSESVQF